MRGELDYRIVDVFTDRPFAGNPLAVVLDAQQVSDAGLAAIAREFNLSETAFVLPSTGPADYRLRIFTPEAELPFAGHPSVGAAWVLARLGRLPAGAVVQECGAGQVRLEIGADAGPVRLFGAPATAAVVDPGDLLAAVGLPATALDASLGAAIGGAGLNFAFLGVLPAALDRVVPDPRLLDRLADTRQVAGLSVLSVAATPGDQASPAFDVRVFAGGVGVPEDPATGSAALGLAAALVCWGALPGDGRGEYSVSQGVAMGRPSRLSCCWAAAGGAVTEVSVLGEVVPVAHGRISPPR